MSPDWPASRQVSGANAFDHPGTLGRLPITVPLWSKKRIIGNLSLLPSPDERVRLYAMNCLAHGLNFITQNADNKNAKKANIKKLEN